MTQALSLPKLLLACAGVLTLLVLSGCTTLSREECLRGDWYLIGESDGRQGHPLSRLDDHRRACRNTLAIVDETAYRAGRDVGLVSYCTPVTGYRVAASGDRYGHVCPVSSEPQFLQGYVLGEQVYRAEREIAVAEDQVRRLERQSEEIDREIEATRVAIDTAGADMDVSDLRATLWQLRQDARQLSADLSVADFALDRARRDFQDVQERTSLQLQLLTSG